VKVVIREAAARDLDDILDWISKDNPQAAARLVRRTTVYGTASLSRRQIDGTV
jgi:plasmid stabilization system protein ParE